MPPPAQDAGIAAVATVPMSMPGGIGAVALCDTAAGLHPDDLAAAGS